MRNIWLCLSVLALVATSCVSNEPLPKHAADEPSFSAGAAETQITCNHDRAKVHQDMYARALALSDGTAKLVLITMDITGLSTEQMDRIRKGIESVTGIPVDRVMINASHTHNAEREVPAGEWQDGLSYADWLIKQCIAVASQANENLRPCVILCGRAPIQVGFNRRLMMEDGNVTMAVNPKGPVVPWTDVVGMYNSGTGERIAVLFTYAAHPVVTQFKDITSSDYPGSAITKLKKLLGGDKTKGLFMFGQGCGGNINAFPLRGGPEACDATGDQLAGAVTRAPLREITPGPLKVETISVTLPYQAPPPVAEVEAAIAKDPADDRLKKLLETAKEGDKPRSREFQMQAVAIGPDLCILALPMEPFCEYQLFADKESPFKHTITLGYCNYDGTYVATAAAYKLGRRGGYEASPYGCALYNPHGLALAPAVEKLIQTGIARLFKRLEKGEEQQKSERCQKDWTY